jgi:hypothetical protein
VARKRRTDPLLARLDRMLAFARELEGDILTCAPELSQLPPVASYLTGDITAPVVNAIRALVVQEEPPERLLLLALHMTATSVVAIAVLGNERVREPAEWHEVWAREIQRSLANANAICELGDALFGDEGWVFQKVQDPAFRDALLEPVAAKDMN